MIMIQYFKSGHRLIMILYELHMAKTTEDNIRSDPTNIETNVQ